MRNIDHRWWTKRGSPLGLPTFEKRIKKRMRNTNINVTFHTANLKQICKMFYQTLKFIVFSFFFNYPPFSKIAFCIGTAGTVTWCLHLTRPCCIALGRVLIRVVSPDWFEEHLNHHSAIYPAPLQFWNYCNTQAHWACLIVSMHGSIL